MSSGSRHRQTMAKLARERSVKERRARKQEKKDEKKAAAAAAREAELTGEVIPTDGVEDETAAAEPSALASANESRLS